MAYIVATGLISKPVPGVWRRLSLISSDGRVMGLEEHQLVARLEELGIPRHQYGLVRCVRSWQRGAIPTDTALALWFLRERVPDGGGLGRHVGSPPEDTGPAIRYLQLALDVGESMQTDPSLTRVTYWLVSQQLPDGSIPANIGTDYGEAGTTARALRVLCRLEDPSLKGAIELMQTYLTQTFVRTAGATGWSYSPHEPTVVTGATSLAVVALLECHAGGELIPEALQFIIDAQDPKGGWPEVPGHTPMIHNTFNAVRALQVARSCGVVGHEIDPVLDRARDWFMSQVSRRAQRTTVDLAYALRLATELDLLQDKRIERFACELVRRRNRTLSFNADLYAETEITAIALQECSIRLNLRPQGHESWAWRWEIPAFPPPFLCRNAYLYELLYGAFRAHWWMKIVDWLVGAEFVDRAVGLLFGMVVSLGIVDDHITSVFEGAGVDLREIATSVLVICLLLLWLIVKASAYRSLLRTLRNSLGSLAAALALTWILLTPATSIPGLVILLGIRWLVIDAIAFTLDTSGLLNRIIPK